MRTYFIKILFLSIIISIVNKQIIYSQASIYYIDFESGLNSNNGLTPETAWQHCPGDENASGNASSSTIEPGDVILFKGGITYRGTIHRTSDGVSYIGDEWPGLEGEKAIIDGSDPLPGTVNECGFAECGSNPDWESISYIDVPEEYNISNSMFFDSQTRLWIAQDPNIPDPYWEDDYSSYNAIINTEMTLSSIKDTSYFTQQDADYWDGSYIMIWVNPNIVTTQKVTGYDPTTSTIYFDTLNDGAIYNNVRNQYYSMINHINLIDFPGECYFDEDNHRLYFWPRDDSELSVVWRDFGFDLRYKNDLLIEGFKIQKFIGARAIYISNSSNIIIRNNETSWIRESGNSHIAAIHCSHINGGLVENNYIHHTQRGSGIMFGSNSENIIIRNNVITTSGYKGIWLRNTVYGIVIGNTLYENKATHGNDMSVFESWNVLVADNLVYNSRTECLSSELMGNFVIHNNVFIGVDDTNGPTGALIRLNFGYEGGYLIVTNNHALYSPNNSGINLGTLPTGATPYIVKNNIVDGGPGFSRDYDKSHNIYTSLSYGQSPEYDWYFSEGEFVEGNLDSIFLNTTNIPEGYKLRENSLAIDAGVDLHGIIPDSIINMFPDYDFFKDIEGKNRGQGEGWDIGAYEYTTGTNMLTASSENKEILQIYPNPFKTETTIEYKLSEQSGIEISLYEINGRLVKTIYSGVESKGLHSIELSSRDLPPGIYFIKLINKNFTVTKKCLLVK